MSKSNSMESGMMLLFFNNSAFANVGNAGGLLGSTVAGSFYVSLHTADPGEAGTQATSEVTYTDYARVAVARSGAGFVVTNNSVSPASSVSFPIGSGGSGTATYFGIGTASSGAGILLYSGAISPGIVTGTGITPILTTAMAITED